MVRSFPLSEDQTFAQLKDWQEQPLGALIARLETEAFTQLCTRLFGYHLVQLGEFGDSQAYLANCPVQAKSILQIGLRSGRFGISALAESFRLPVATDSIDALILPHTLDFSIDPHQLLREADRVLIPNGRLVLSGFNPWSLLGLRRLTSIWNKAVPWTGQFVPYYRLEDWLSLIGFEIETTDVLMFRPAFTRESWLYRFALLERYGKRFWPMLAGVYVVSAVKRVSRLTPIVPRWRRLRPTGASVIEPTTRGFHRE